MEDLLASHRKQLRDLQSVITQKKKSATKKTRRGVNDECERLERELKEKQAAEIAALEKDDDNDSDDTDPENEVDVENEDLLPDPITSKLETTSLHDPPISPLTPETTEPTNHDRLKKPSRQKARLARRAAQIHTLTVQAAAEAASTPDRRALEREKMQKLFEEYGLLEVPIPPDGHCLYSAFAVGLEDVGVSLLPYSFDKNLGGEGEGEEIVSNTPKKRSHTYTRAAAASYISSHSEDFVPFLEEGESLESHVEKVGKTAEWGGQMEILALARSYGVVVKVVQAEGVGVTSMNDDNDEDGEKKREIWLAYHRRGYGLGEHYNALRKRR